MEHTNLHVKRDLLQCHKRPTTVSYIDGAHKSAYACSIHLAADVHKLSEQNFWGKNHYTVTLQHQKNTPHQKKKTPSSRRLWSSACQEPREKNTPFLTFFV